MKSSNYLKLLITFVSLAIVFIISSCASNYGKSKRSKVIPIECTKTNEENKNNVRKLLLLAGYPESSISVTDKYFSIRNKVYEYNRLKFIRLVIKGDRRWVKISHSEGTKMVYAEKNHDVAINASYSLYCLAEANGQVLTNTKTIKVVSKDAETDKYDKLAKLKALLDSGAINQQEYDVEKSKLLKQ